MDSKISNKITAYQHTNVSALNQNKLTGLYLKRNKQTSNAREGDKYSPFKNK